MSIDPPRKLADGRTAYTVRVYVESRDAKTDRRRKITRVVYSKQEAIALDAQLKVEAAGGAVADSKRTVKDLMEAWLESGAGELEAENKKGWSPTTEYGYRRIVEREILPVLGRIKLSRLSARQLDRLYKDMRDEGHAGNSIRNVHRVMTASLNRAVKWGWIPYSVAARATLGPILGGDGRVATEEEVRSLLAVADPTMAFAIRLACATGMRRSELAGLLWSDIDLKEGVITVKRALVDAGGSVFNKDTKTHATRVVPLAESTLQMLKDRRGIGSVLAASPRGLSNHLDELVEKAGIQGDGFGWHAFRHYAGTELAGVTDLRTVADILGHKTLRTTERYVHAKAARSKAAVEALNDALS